MTITANDVLQHLPLVLYLLAVAGLSANLFPRPRNVESFLFVLAALGSLCTTWTYMFKYMYQSYQDHKSAAGLLADYSTTRWLEETSLFDEAWRYVCQTPMRWWISSQLCLVTVGVFTVFLYAEGSRHPALRGKVTRFMILGQIVAISFASALLLATLAKIQTTRSSSAINSAPTSTYILQVCVVLAFVTVFIVPYTVQDKSFLPNLLIMHILITVPLLQLSSSSSSKPSQQPAATPRPSTLPFKRIYWSVALVSALMHMHHSLPALSSVNWSLDTFGYAFWNTIYSYPAQSSISWDVICTNGIWQLWSFMEIWKLSKGKSLLDISKASLCVGLVPTFGSAAGIAAFLAIREDWLVHDANKAVKKAK